MRIRILPFSFMRIQADPKHHKVFKKKLNGFVTNLIEREYTEPIPYPKSFFRNRHAGS